MLLDLLVSAIFLKQGGGFLQFFWLEYSPSALGTQISHLSLLTAVFVAVCCLHTLITVSNLVMHFIFTNEDGCFSTDKPSSHAACSMFIMRGPCQRNRKGCPPSPCTLRVLEPHQLSANLPVQVKYSCLVELSCAHPTLFGP